MKETFTQKFCCLALGALFLSPQLKATEPVKVDYTDFLKNPSFEFYADGAVLDVKNGDSRLLGSNPALRGTPPCWKDDANITVSASTSYGINRGAVNKDGYNAMWYSPGTGPLTFKLFQKVGGLPAGQYRLSCKLYVASTRLSNQRLFASTEAANTVVQYYGAEADYRVAATETTPATTNIIEGETASFAGWAMNDKTGDGDTRLKPMSVIINVAEGDSLSLGILSGRLKKDGTTTTTSVGFFKADDFRLTRLPEPVDPNDFTYKIKNPDFELKIDGITGEYSQITSAGIDDADRGTPAGWSDINKESITLTSESLYYGVKGEANNGSGAKSCWVQCTPFANTFTLYQNITGLPAGRYQVSCNMFLETGMITNQRLFANNNVQYYGSESDYASNKTDGEINSFAGLTTSDDNISNRFFEDMSVVVDVTDTLRIGIKTSNVKGNGTTDATRAGWFTVDNFKLKRIGDLTGLDANMSSNSYFTVNGQKDGFSLNLDKATFANVKVLSLSGQAVYVSQISSTNTWISLPQGLYIVQVSANGMNKAVKVLVK